MGVDARVILSQYKSELPQGEEVKVHTPDPTKYHDPGRMMLGTDGDKILSHVLGRSAGFGGWRGVMIPHATQLGGSMGFNHHKPAPQVYIDPELNNKSIVIDMGQFRNEHAKAALAQACSEAHQQCHDPRDAAVVTYGAFANDPGAVGYSPVEVTLQRGNEQATVQHEEVRQAPLNMPGTYVVPKATPGGGQYKQASFSRQQPAPMQAAPQPQPVQQQYVPPPQPNPEPPSMPPNIPAAAFRDSFNQQPQAQAAPQVPLQQQMVSRRQQRMVVFDMPKPFGRFTTYYHDVVRGEGLLVLIVDHSQMNQMVWFPPAMDAQSGNPEPLAAFVSGTGQNDPDMIYLLYPTGLTFRYGDKEFCLLTVDKEQPAPKDALG